ncbi:Uncharacterized protein TCM_044158 [Theobroma cacao]|uniref:DUF4283 domain-containing protein n=1 Tax=Theobroma cacao TaxID=3641 RepID=A0A061FQ81_THECC|nr:Uncharacterized protein TCM_044158 [Theobroma cacao]
MAVGRPPDPLPTLPPVATPSMLQSGATPNALATENSKPSLSHGHTQAPVSPRTQKKSFLAVAAGEKSSLIPLDREPFWYKDRPAASFFDDEISTLAQPFKFSMVGKFSRMLRMQEIRVAFKGIGLIGAYEIRWLDYKHILIQLSNEHDLNRIWLKQVWFISNQKMRVFKWSPEFQPEKESSMVPVWISFPNLKAHLYEKSALSAIVKTVGRPLMVDEATANGTRPSVARVCVEFDCQQPPIDQVWIVTRNRQSGSVMGGYMQKVEFARLSEFCTHCSHVGHGVSSCMVIGNRPEKNKQPMGGKKQLKKEDKDRTNARKGDLKPQEEKETEPIQAEQQKQSTRWQVMARPGPSSAKGTRGEELVLNAQKKVQVQLSNRFEAVGLMDDAGNEKQGQTECVNSDIMGKQFFLSEQYGEKKIREGKVVQIVEKEDDWRSQHAAGELPETSAREEISSTRSPVVERVNSSMHIPDNIFKGKGPQQVMVGTHQVERKILDDLSGTKEQEKGEGTRNATQAAMGESLRIDAVLNARTANTTGDPVNSRRDDNPGIRRSTYATMEESWKTGEDTNDSVAKDGDFDHVQWAIEAGHVSFRKAKEKKHRKLEDQLSVTAMHGDGQMISEVRQSFGRMLAEDSQVGSKEIASSTASIHGGLVEGSGENNQEMSHPENKSALSPHGRQQLGSNSRLEWQQSDSRSSYNPCNRVSVEAPRGAEILKNSGENSQEVSQPGNEQELSPDDFLQHSTIHSKERAIQANLIAKDVEPIPHRVVMLDEKEDTDYGLCGFNKEPSMVPSLENFQLRVQQISGSERHQEKPSTGINQSRDPSQDFHENKQ